MLIGKDGKIIHVVPANVCSTGHVLSVEQTADGIYFDRDYTLVYRIEDNDGKPLGNPYNFTARGADLINSIGAAIQLCVMSGYVSYEDIDLWTVRMACQHTLSVYSTLQIIGKSKKTCDRLKSYYDPKLVEFIKKCERNANHNELARHMIYGYMWLSFSEDRFHQKVIVTDIPAPPKDQIDALITSGNWQKWDGYGKSFKTVEEFRDVIGDGLLAKKYL